MICNVCETKLNENELVCSKCGELVAVNEKKKELELQKEKTKKIISENISSTKGLVYGVFLTVILVISLIAAVDSLLDKSYIGAIICILSFAMALNSVLAVWNLYKKKDGDVQKWLKNLGNYSKFLNAMWVFVTIIVIFICTILLLIGLAANELASDLGGFLNEVELFGTESSEVFGELSEVITDAGAIILFAVIIACVIFVTLTLNIQLTYKNATKFYNELSNSYNYGTYNYNKVPIYRSYIFGGIEIALSIYIILSDWSTGLFLLSVGGYTLTTGLLFSDIHKNESNNAMQIIKLGNELKDLQTESSKLLAMKEAKRKEEEVLKNREHERMMEAMMAKMLQDKKEDN